MREPAYRRALAQVSTPLDAVGEPIEQFLVLPNPTPGAAPADTALQFSGTPNVGGAADATWAGVIVANAEAAPAVADAGAERRADRRPADRRAAGQGRRRRSVPTRCWRRISTTTSAPTSSSPRAPASRSCARATDGRFTDVTQATTLPASITGAPARAVWAADVDTDGDLDVVLAPAPLTRAPMLLRNNGDGTFAAQQPFAASAA